MNLRILLALSMLALWACDPGTMAGGTSSSSGSSGQSSTSTAEQGSSQGGSSAAQASSSPAASGSSSTGSSSSGSSSSGGATSGTSSSGGSSGTGSSLGGASSSGPSCTCTASNSCCDGCQPINVAGSCDDALFCTTNDTCSAQGVCTGATRDCTGQVTTGQCEVPACNEAENRCEARPGRLNESCDDNDVCTTGTTCQADATCSGTAISCDQLITAAGCQQAMCHPTTGCFIMPVNEAMPCDDGLFCTVNTVCSSAGACTGAARDCASAILEPECQANATCDETGGRCVADSVNAGMACNDDNFCTDNTTCQADGTCMGGAPHDCSGITLAACQVGSCNAQEAKCEPKPAMDNAPCSDGDACTQVDTCSAGMCVGSSPTQCPETACAEEGMCNPASGECEARAKADGLLCMGAPQTLSECSGGACAAVACVRGYGDCSGGAACETDLLTDVMSCGSCGNACRTGTRFQHARTDCRGGGCAFLGCDPGWADVDNDCANGSCLNGCEACEPMGDGSFDIPDDGADNDCQADPESTNSDIRGWYVDVAFAETGTGNCAGGGVRGTRRCPFTTLAGAMTAADAAATLQNWTPPAPSRRYVYLAEGNYTAPSIVFSTTLPLVIAGGYKRTVTGAWTRDGGPTEVASTDDTPSVPAARIWPSAGWAVLDRINVKMGLDVRGRAVLRGIQQHSMWGWAPAVGNLYSNVNADARVTLLDSRIAGIDFMGCAGVLCTSTVLNNVDIVEGTSLTGTTFGGTLYGVHGWKLTNVRIAKHIYAASSSATYLEMRDVRVGGTINESHVRAYHSVFTGPVTLTAPTILDGVIIDTTAMSADVDRHITVSRPLGGGVCTVQILKSKLLSGSSLDLCGTISDSTLRSVSPTQIFPGAASSRNTFESRVILYASSHVMNNIFRRGVDLTAAGDMAFAHNVVGSDTSDALLSVVGREGTTLTPVVFNNIFLLPVDGPATMYAIKENPGAATANATMVKNNAFIGLGAGRFPMLDSGAAILSVADLNVLVSFPACGRGGNVAFSSAAAAGLLSASADSSLVGQHKNGGALVDAAQALPYACNGFTVPSPGTSDVSGGSRVCRGSADVGPYELCP